MRGERPPAGATTRSGLPCEHLPGGVPGRAVGKLVPAASNRDGERQQASCDVPGHLPRADLGLVRPAGAAQRQRRSCLRIPLGGQRASDFTVVAARFRRCGSIPADGDGTSEVARLGKRTAGGFISHTLPTFGSWTRTARSLRSQPKPASPGGGGAPARRPGPAHLGTTQ